MVVIHGLEICRMLVQQLLLQGVVMLHGEEK